MDTTTTSKQARYSRAEREQLLSLYAASGQRIEEFAAAQSIKPATLSLWLQKQRRANLAAAASGFQAVAIPALMGGGAWAAEIVVDQRHTVRLGGGVDPRWVGELLNQLRRLC